MYRSIFIQICAVGSKRRIFSAPECVLAVQGRSGSSYLAPFLSYGDLLAKNCLFFLPLSHSAPSLPMFPLEFRAEVNREETRVMWLSSSEDRMIVAVLVLA